MKIFKFINSFLMCVLIYTLIFYKKAISPFMPHACRFKPTCSEYMLQAIKKNGIFWGVYLGIKRICRCHPWGKCGYDPVPNIKSKKNRSNSHKVFD